MKLIKQNNPRRKSFFALAKVKIILQGGISDNVPVFMSYGRDATHTHTGMNQSHSISSVGYFL